MKRDTYYLIAIVVLGALAIFFHLQHERAKEKVLNRESTIAEKNDVIRYRTNSEGRLLAEKRAAEIYAKDLAKMYPQVFAELKKEFDIKEKNLKAYIRNEFSALGTGTGVVTEPTTTYDTITKQVLRFRDFSMNDGYLNFTAKFYDSLLKAPYNYIYSDTAKTAVHTKKKWLLAKEQLFATTLFSNPNAKITGTTNILVNNYKDKRFGVMIAGGYDPFRSQPVLMVGVGYTLFKF